MAIQKSALQTVVSYIHTQICQESKQKPPDDTGSDPFILGISGLQGSGKSTWASAIAQSLQQKFNLAVVIVSLDDFYHNHESLVQLRAENPGNNLLRTRGQPGTHDEQLADVFFKSLKRKPGTIQIPAFDKSLFNGEGDRVPLAQWEVVPADTVIDVLIFEGWCIGFKALSEDVLKHKWEQSHQTFSASSSERDAYLSANTLCDHALAHLITVNSNLKRYNKTFMRPSNFSYLIHLDTKQLSNVYKWRLDQEHALREKKGVGMPDEEVINFVRGYMPAYELYLERLQRESFVPRKLEELWRSGQLRVTLDEYRRVKSIEEIY